MEIVICPFTVFSQIQPYLVFLPGICRLIFFLQERKKENTLHYSDFFFFFWLCFSHTYIHIDANIFKLVFLKLNCYIYN